MEQSRTRYGRPVGEVEQTLQACQARRSGGEPWEAIGVETVAEVVERIRTRKRGSGASKKGSRQESARPETEISPEHVLYTEPFSWEAADGET